jgi:hypothetical protein
MRCDQTQPSHVSDTTLLDPNQAGCTGHCESVLIAVPTWRLIIMYRNASISRLLFRYPPPPPCLLFILRRGFSLLKDEQCVQFPACSSARQWPQVTLWANKVGPYENPQETYPYYMLPFCKVSFRTLRKASFRSCWFGGFAMVWTSESGGKSGSDTTIREFPIS